MNRDDHEEELNLLCDALISLEDRESCKAFLEDICTINEIHSLVQRLQVACMLEDNKTYLDIAQKTSASTATISRVNRCLNYGSNGYKTVIRNLSKIKRDE